MTHKLFILLALIAIAIPAYSVEPQVPIKFNCAADQEDDMAKTFCSGMKVAFAKLDYVRPSMATDKLYFDLGFTPIQANEDVLFVGMYVSYFDARFKGLRLAVYTGSLMFSREEVAVDPQKEQEQTAKQFDVIATSIMLASKDWYEFAYPLLKDIRVGPSRNGYMEARFR
jgi:hypothetical protein